MDDTAVIAVMHVFDCSFEAASKFLKSDAGCYVHIDGEQHWMSGMAIARVLEAKE